MEKGKSSLRLVNGDAKAFFSGEKKKLEPDMKRCPRCNKRKVLKKFKSLHHGVWTDYVKCNQCRYELRIAKKKEEALITPEEYLLAKMRREKGNTVPYIKH